MPFEFEQVTIPLSAVNCEKEPFRISSGSERDISGSLKRVGLISPPIMIPEMNARFVTVCGHRRIAAARALGWNEIPARLLPESTEAIICARLSVGENISERPLDLLETSRALSLMSDLIKDPRKFHEAIEDLGLPHTWSIVEKLLPLCKLPGPLQEGIASGTLALPSVQMLSRFPGDSRLLIGRFLMELRLSLHRQREFIVLIDEIAANEEIPHEAILSVEPITKLLNDSEMDMPRKAGLIRKYLKKRRFPNLTAAQEAFDDLKGELKLGDGANLTPPPGFESNRFTFSFTFFNIPDLIKQARNIERISENPRLSTYLSQRDVKPS